MSYNKRTWANGNVVGAVDLNRIENGIADIDVDEIRGWSVSSGSVTLCDETVTTQSEGGDNIAILILGSEIEADVITVTYDSTTYTCANDEGVYGAPPGDFSQYPFSIMANGLILCETAGTHAVKIETAITLVETSQSFIGAVVSASPISQIIINKTTWQQAHDAMASGKLCYYTALVDGDEVEMFVALNTAYNTDQDRYEIIAVGAPIDSLAVGDVIYASSSTGVLRRD